MPAASVSWARSRYCGFVVSPPSPPPPAFPPPARFLPPPRFPPPARPLLGPAGQGLPDRSPLRPGRREDVVGPQVPAGLQQGLTPVRGDVGEIPRAVTGSRHAVTGIGQSRQAQIPLPMIHSSSSSLTGKCLVNCSMVSV